MRNARAHLYLLAKYFSGDMQDNIPGHVLLYRYQLVLPILPHECQDLFPRMCLENISLNEHLALGQVSASINCLSVSITPLYTCG